MRYLRSVLWYVLTFLIGLAVGFVPVFLLALGSGEAAAGVALIVGAVTGFVAIPLLLSGLRSPDPKQRRLQLLAATLVAGIAIGALPLSFATFGWLCSNGFGTSACSAG